MKTAKQKALEAGMRLRAWTTGTHKTTCFVCSAGRKKKNDPCLYVNILDDGGILYKCFNPGCTNHGSFQNGDGNGVDNAAGRGGKGSRFGPGPAGRKVRPSRRAGQWW